MRDDEDSTGSNGGDTEEQHDMQSDEKTHEAGSSAAVSGKKLPVPYAKRRSTKEKRRDAEVRVEVKARKRSWRENKEIKKREDKIRRERSGVCDASGKLTPDGKIYLKYFREATQVMAECADGDMDYLIRLGRLLTQFRSPTQWREKKRHWLRHFERDIGLEHSKANNLVQLWRRFGNDLDRLRHYPRRKLLAITRSKGLQPSDLDSSELLDRMLSLRQQEIKKLSPEQLAARLRGDDVTERGDRGKGGTPGVIEVSPGCRIVLANDYRSLTIHWGFSDEDFQRRMSQEVERQVTRALRVREKNLPIYEEKC